MSTHSVPFDFLPSLIKNTILQKLTYKDFAKFDQCSQSSHKLCQKSSAKLPIECRTIWIGETNVTVLFYGNTFGDLPFAKAKNANFEVATITVTTTLSVDICNFLLSNVKKVNNLNFILPITSHFTEVSSILQKLKPQKLEITLADLDDQIPYDISGIKTIKILNCLSLEKETIFSLEAMEVSTYHANRITADDIAGFVKECLNSTSNFSYKELSRLPPFTSYDISSAFRRICPEFYIVQKRSCYGTHTWKVKKNSDVSQHFEVVLETVGVLKLCVVKN